MTRKETMVPKEYTDTWEYYKYPENLYLYLTLED